MTTTAGTAPPNLIQRIMNKPFVAHIIRAATRFTERLGTHFAAAITYFSFLTLVPLLMLVFSITGFVLANQPDLLDDVRESITAQLPGGAGASLEGVIDSAIDARLSVGVVALVIALYTGTNWIGNIRASIQAQWRADFDENQEILQESLITNFVKNLVRLLGLGLAIVLSVALSLSGGALQPLLVNWFGLDDIGWVQTVLRVVPILLAVVADTLIFFWIYSSLSPKDSTVPRKNILRGAVLAAVGFEILKLALTTFLPMMLNSPTAQVFGSIIGLLFFINFAATLLLFVAAWIATAELPEPEHTWLEERADLLDKVPPTVQLVAKEESVAAPVKAAGLLGVGAVLGAAWARRRPRR